MSSNQTWSGSHRFNRIVRRSNFCGFDPHTNTDDSHRHDWFFRRLKTLAEHFAIDALNQAFDAGTFGSRVSQEAGSVRPWMRSVTT